MPVLVATLDAVPSDVLAGVESVPVAAVCAAVVCVALDDVFEHADARSRTTKRVEHRRAQSIKCRTLAVGCCSISAEASQNYPAPPNIS